MVAPIRWRLLGGLLILAAPSAALLRAAELIPARFYEITTETGLPHLEENLRYTTRQERRCLVNQPLSAVFPILEHPALQGCKLQDETKQGDTVSYQLVCVGGHGTTGQALWHLDGPRISGTLNIKLGGKNMTFYQRITAVPLGNCSAS